MQPVKNFPPEMSGLHPAVKAKALEIYQQLSKENLMPHSLAIMSSIKQAHTIFDKNKV